MKPQAASAGALPGPDGYAFRYPDGIRFTNGEAINGSRPLDSLPYYFESSLAAHDQKVRHEITIENLGAFEDAICRYQTKEAILDFIRKRRKAMESECGTA